MEVVAGYKLTDVGMIPDQWEAKPLRDVLAKGRLGGNYANSDAETAFPLMKMGNIARGHFDLRKIQFISSGDVPDPVHRLARGDVLFNTRNTLDLVGKVAIWRDELPVAYYNSNLLRLEFNPEIVCSSDYANLFLNTERSVAQLRALATGTTSVAAIYTRDLLGLPFAVPPPAEQCAIAAALGDVDALLSGLDRIIAKKRDLKQAALQKLITGQIRLPGFQGDWAEMRLDEVGTFHKGAGVKKDQARSGDLPCVRYGEIYTHHHECIRQFNSWISRDVAKTAIRLKPGDLLFAGSGETKTEIGKCVAFVDACEAYAGGDIVILRPVGVDSTFMGYYLNTTPLNAQKASRGQGDAVVHISAAALGSITVKIPVLSEQSAIAKVLSDMDAEIIILDSRRIKTHALKQAMMQELLTGKTRLV